ncbi:MAG: hypothetical protein QM775_30315 [Pirellulales bacterium]
MPTLRLALCCCLVTCGPTFSLANADEPSLGVETPHGDGMVILLDGKRTIGELRFDDETIRRPYLCAVKTPRDIQVTRRHPPIVGEDAVDHDTMHPGIWFALGDLSGQDFCATKPRSDKISCRTKPVS